MKKSLSLQSKLGGNLRIKFDLKKYPYLKKVLMNNRVRKKNQFYILKDLQDFEKRNKKLLRKRK